MTRNQFVKTCVASGYCRKETADLYVRSAHRLLYRPSDMLEVYRIDRGIVVLRIQREHIQIYLARAASCRIVRGSVFSE